MGEEDSATPLLAELHLQAWALLKNGMGGLDWAGLPWVMEHLGLNDATALIDDLRTIKTYQPPE